MKSSISAPVAAAIVAIVLVVIGLIGYKVFVAKETSGKPPPEAQKWLHPGSNGMAEHGNQKLGGPPAGASAAQMQEFYRNQQKKP